MIFMKKKRSEYSAINDLFLLLVGVSPTSFVMYRLVRAPIDKEKGKNNTQPIARHTRHPCPTAGGDRVSDCKLSNCCVLREI